MKFNDYLKNFVVLFIFLAVLPLNIFAKQKQPNAQVLFINQVRGDECCDKGNLENLTRQINKFIESEIPAYFAIRYDVLKNPEYLSYLKLITQQYPDIIKLGLLLEITPDLAKDSQVQYRGSAEKWYEAQNIFSIGYSLENNKKIMDTIFEKFHENFGYYPQLTSAWMIETQTLNYIHDKYKVKIHQITREQWQTDSYTLYGGPPHYPFPTSSNWVIIPDYDRINPPLIVRQTIIDPLLNYGDNTNAFTSQPNDYIRDKKRFDYFKNLIDQAINQPNTGFALLGLENSMDKEFNDEYLKQIDYVKKLITDRLVTIFTIGDLVSFWSKQKVTIYQGKDLVKNTDNMVYWITTPQYRARLRVNKNDVVLTDLRIFNKDFIDPYTNSIAKKQGFWIVPYLIDGSHGYLPKESKKQLVDNVVFDVKNDDNLNIGSIKLPKRLNNDLIISNKSDSIKVKYQNNTANTLISFNAQDIVINCPACKEVEYNDHNPQSHPIKYEKRFDGFVLKWFLENRVSQSLIYKCQTKECKISITSRPDLLTDERIKQYPYFFPEPVDRDIDINQTIIYPHNQYAIAGRNPVRIIVIPVDVYNIPLKINEPIEIITKEKINYNQVSHGLIQYIDIVSDKPIALNPKIKIKGKEVRKINVFFAPDCKKQVKYCLENPLKLWWYINSFIGDKYRRYILGEKQ